MFTDGIWLYSTEELARRAAELSLLGQLIDFYGKEAEQVQLFWEPTPEIRELQLHYIAPDKSMQPTAYSVSPVEVLETL